MTHDEELLSKTEGGRKILAERADRVGKLTRSLAEHDRSAPTQAERASHSKHSSGQAILAEHDLRRARLEGRLAEAKKGNRS